MEQIFEGLLPENEVPLQVSIETGEPVERVVSSMDAQNMSSGTALTREANGTHAGDIDAELSDLGEIDELTENLLLEIFHKE